MKQDNEVLDKNIPPAMVEDLQGRGFGNASINRIWRLTGTIRAEVDKVRDWEKGRLS